MGLRHHCCARHFHWLIGPDDQGPAGVVHAFIGVLYAVMTVRTNISRLQKEAR